jgi:hypothetical protein
MAVPIKQFIRKNKFYICLVYLWYVGMFSCLYEVLDIKIVYFMVVPLVFSTAFFVRFLQEVVTFIRSESKMNNFA